MLNAFGASPGGEDGAGIPTPKKQLRISAYHHLQALDSGLQSICNFGLSEFLPREGDADKPLLELPVLVSNEDSGPIPTCAKGYRLHHMKLREMCCRDVFHMLWGVLLNGPQQAGVRPLHLRVVEPPPRRLGPNRLPGGAIVQEDLLGDVDVREVEVLAVQLDQVAEGLFGHGTRKVPLAVYL